MDENLAGAARRHKSRVNQTSFLAPTMRLVSTRLRKTRPSCFCHENSTDYIGALAHVGFAKK